MRYVICVIAIAFMLAGCNKSGNGTFSVSSLFGGSSSGGGTSMKAAGLSGAAGDSGALTVASSDSGSGSDSSSAPLASHNPEPATIALMATGLAGYALIRRRKKGE